MDMAPSQSLAELETTLTILAAKGTARAVAAKINGIRQEKSVEAVRNAYDEIVNELLEERAQAILLAQTFKDELDRVEIDEDGIKSLDATIGRVFEIIKHFPGVLDGDPEKSGQQEASFEQIRALISADTLRTMQLLGFNYKAAIGEPLTELCANAIKKIGSGKSNRTGRQQQRK